ncbi:MAG: leader peptidase (prepilin peptidase) / N-methyltransferase [Pseudonocardiales bacterium]|nr:leader peptidase (prepilin peptidase) / N-methyltransferase [Pseudonocardiales bacterium]
MTTMSPVAVWAALAGLFGLAIGSFLNVVIYRVPAGESVVSPASRCPSCSSEIHNRHNIPVLGWLILRGRCFACKAAISPRYPIVEAATAALFVILTLRILHLHLGSALPAYLYFAAAGLALAVIDLDHKRLPDKIVLPSYAVVAVLLTVASVATHDWWALARAGIGGAALFAFYFALAFAYPAGMGFGDVKLSGIIGGVLAYLSWTALLVGAFGGFLLGAAVGVAVMATKRGDRKTALPFGPFMIAGALIAIFVAAPIADSYLYLLGRR